MARPSLRIVVVLTALACASVTVSSQAAAPVAPASVPAAPASVSVPSQAKPTPPPPTETYTYLPDGRRDPFLNLLGTGIETPKGSRRVDGPASMSASDISVRGVVQSRGALIAMVEGPDKKTYIVHQGDKLLDGTIRAITQQGLVIVQEVDDLLSLVKQREVRKLLHTLEEAKE